MPILSLDGLNYLHLMFCQIKTQRPAFVMLVHLPVHIREQHIVSYKFDVILTVHRR